MIKKYQYWKNLVNIQGPPGLRLLKGFHDEALKGEWKGYRSSRLNLKWRVIYKTISNKLEVIVEEVNPHDY